MRYVRNADIEAKTSLRVLADRVGVAEILRAVAGIIANDHPDITSGDYYCRKLNAIAEQLALDGRV
jgi:hypothetical protein